MSTCFVTLLHMEQGLPQLERFYFNWEKEYNAETIFWFIGKV